MSEPASISSWAGRTARGGGGQALLGAMNVGAFFALIYLAAQQLDEQRGLDDHGGVADHADADGLGPDGRAAPRR